MVLMIDTNVLLDVICHRNEFFDASNKVLELCKNQSCVGIIAAHSITNMMYILRKVYSEEQRRIILLALIDIFEVAALDKKKLVSALHRNDFSDFEDCLQDECAASLEADLIITRNVVDFEHSGVKAITPEEFISLQRVE